jgi:hypothetical protein
MTKAQPRRQVVPGKRRGTTQYQPRSIPWSTAYAPAPDVTWSVQDREAVLFSPANGRYYTLNRVGTVIWELLDGQRPLAAVLTALAEHFDASEPQLRRDLLALVRQLGAERLIRERR